MNDVRHSFIEAMRAAGVAPVDPALIQPGEICRFDVEGSKRGSKSGWARLYTDFPPSGSFGCYSRNIKKTWTVKLERALTEEEKAELAKRQAADRQRRKREQEEREREAASRAKTLWERAKPASPDHAYLTRKRIKPGPARTIHGAVVLPVHRDRKLVGLQFIAADGNKRFMKGTPKAGGYTLIGSKPDPTGVVVVCEGFATGASINEATGLPVVVAFDSGNLKPVCEGLRAALGVAAKIIVAADDDRWKPEHGNVGITKAAEAASACQGEVRRPMFRPGFEGQPTDFNDLAVMYGAAEVKAQIETGKPTVEQALSPVDELRPDLALLEPFPHMTPQMKPRLTIENTAELLRRVGATVSYNVMAHRREVLIQGETFIQDNAMNDAMTRLVSWANYAGMPTKELRNMVDYLASKNAYSPVERWIKSRPWDGRSRLPEFFATVKAVGEADDEVRKFKETLILKWLVSAVAAAAIPEGISAHGVLTLLGKQYAGKTMWFKKLCPPEMRIDGETLFIGNKDSELKILSRWLVELGELDGTFTKSDIAHLKAFITKDKDVLRAPYKPEASEFPRKTVFVASVNQREYLVDKTGNRRFWTIDCAGLDCEHNIDMQQVWAEVFERPDLFNKGQPGGLSWYLTREEVEKLNERNADFQQADPIEARLADAFDFESTVGWTWRTASELLYEIGIERTTKGELNAAAAFIRLKNNGLEKKVGSRRLLMCPPRRPRIGF